jgi:hypothetical protein
MDHEERERDVWSVGIYLSIVATRMDEVIERQYYGQLDMSPGSDYSSQGFKHSSMCCTEWGFVDAIRVCNQLSQRI